MVKFINLHLSCSIASHYETSKKRLTMYLPLLLTAIITAITVSTFILATIISPKKLIPIALTIYFALIVFINR